MKQWAALGLSALLCVSLLGCGSAQETPSSSGESDVKWDEEVDFLVVGYGLAGEAAALEANDIDPQAKVLVLEKMNEDMAGGNSIASGQTFIIPAEDDLETFETYLKSCAEPNPIPDEYTTWLTEQFASQPKWIQGTVAPAGYEVGYVGGGPARWGKVVVEFADLPGGDFKGTSAHIRTVGTTFEPGGLWHGFNAAVKLRENIEVRYGTFATELVQDPQTGEILGVVASDWNGKETYIRSRKGVLLSCGGYENNLEMQRDFHGVDLAYTSGTPGNTGDGIHMLMKVGAKIWHMKNQTQSGGFWLGIKTDEFDPTFILNMTFTTGDYLQIGADDNRFYDESRTYHRQHMKAKKYGKYLDLPHDQALPVHFIFDEDFRTSNIIISPWLSWPITTEGYQWSADNSAEIEKGWIIKADTIEELAEKIGRDPEAVRASVDRFNAMVDAGEDADFQRDPTTMAKIDNGPFYAVNIVPTLVATTGGAERNTKSQVLDWNDEVIPGLYEAGELGSYVSNLYQNGVFLSEAIASGRAAAQTAFNGQSTVTSDFEILEAEEQVGTSIFADEKDGTYPLEVTNMHDTYEIIAKISVGKLALLEKGEGTEAMFMTDEQFAQFVDEITSKQSIEVDTISGATSESQAILDALRAQFE